MPYTEASKQATYKYRKEKYARVNLDLKKEKKDMWKAAADAVGQTLNGYIAQAVEERIEREGGVTHGDD